MEFLPALADAKNYPSLKVRALPTNKTVREGNYSARKLPKDITCLGPFDHARTGLYVVAKTVTSQKIWIPSYHCPALVEPFIFAGKSVSFYPVNKDLTPDFSFLNKQVKTGDTVVGIRYFGFDCQIEKLAVFCLQNKSLLIEDLAHAAFFHKLYAGVAVTSLIKFYPVSQGGELLLSSSSSLVEPLANALKRLPSNNVTMLKNFINKVITKFLPKKPNIYRYFLKKNCSRSINLDDLNVIGLQNQSEIILTRQKNYRYLIEKLGTSPWGQVLIPELPEKVTPYVVPFLLNNCDGFDHIRQKGIQIYRWEEMVFTTCAVSKKYRSTLIQLPCHQDLTRQDLDLIVTVLMENVDE